MRAEWKPTQPGIYRLNGDRVTVQHFKGTIRFRGYRDEQGNAVLPPAQEFDGLVYREHGEVIPIPDVGWSLIEAEVQDFAPTPSQVQLWPWWRRKLEIIPGEITFEEGLYRADSVTRQWMLQCAPIQPSIMTTGVLAFVPLEVCGDIRTEN